MLFFIGVIAGLAYGLSAFGGSLVAVPMLVLVLGISGATAMSMNLWMLVVLAIITAGDGVRARLPQPGTIWPFAVVASAASGLGVIMSIYAGETLLNYIYAPLCVLAGVTVLLLARRLPAEVILPRGALAVQAPVKPTQSQSARHTPVLPLFSGSLGGLFAGVFGASGALFLVPAFGRVFKRNAGQAVACAEMAILPALLVAVVVSLLLQRPLEWQPTGLMIFGALAGLSVARMLASHLRPAFWNSMIGLLLLGAGVWLGLDRM